MPWYDLIMLDKAHRIVAFADTSNADTRKLQRLTERRHAYYSTQDMSL